MNQPNCIKTFCERAAAFMLSAKPAPTTAHSGRLLITLLAMLLTTVTAGAHNLPASGSCGTNATYAITGSEGNYTLTISGTGAIDEYAFVNIGYETVDLSGITSVVITEGITSIGNSAFNNDYDIHAAFTSLSIPASVTSIGDDAFNCCHNLSTVTIANGSHLQSIGDGAFSDCHFSSLVLPCAELSSVGGAAFSNGDDNNQNLTEIVCLTQVPLSSMRIGTSLLPAVRLLMQAFKAVLAWAVL